MNKRLGRNIIYGLAVLAFVGVLWYGAVYDRRPGMPLKQSGNAALAEGLCMEESQAEAEREESGASGEDFPEESGAVSEYAEIAVETAVPGGRRKVSLFWQEDRAYLFLPSFADLKDLTWKYDERKYSLALNGGQVRDAERFALAPGETGTIACARDGQELGEYPLTVMQSDTLPAVFIDTESGSTAYLNEDKTHEEVGAFVCVLADGRLDSAGRLGKISGRGYSSFAAAKKSYGLRFDARTDVLGMGSARKWVLQANAFDLSRMRNKVVYDLAVEMGVPYAVESAYVDLYLNGTYAGNYLLCEKVEAGPERVEIARGCLMEGVFASRAEEEAAYSTFLGSRAGWYEIVYPENISEEELEKMRAFMDEVAALIEQSGSEDSYERLKELTDMESFIRMFLLDELTNEADLNRASTFYFTSDDGRLYAGPVWDYDRSLGNVKSYAYSRLDCFAVGLGERLFQSPYFRQDAADSYNRYYRDLMARCGAEHIEELRGRIRSSIAMDTVRWSAEGDNRYTIFNDVCDGFEDGVTYLKDYFEIRYRLVDDLINEPGKYRQVEFVNTGAASEHDSQRLWVRHGEMIPEDVMDYLAGKYECDLWLCEDGTEYWPQAVVEDVRLLSGRSREN